MIAAMGGNITNLQVNCAGYRPATKSLAVTATLGYSSLNTSPLNSGPAHRDRPIKDANLLDRVRKTRSTNIRHRPPATKSP
jgi:hypothetical protein